MIKLYQTTSDNVFWNENQYCFAIVYKKIQTRVCNGKAASDKFSNYSDKKRYNNIYNGELQCEQ
jgi:hypothetical protein